MNQKTGIFFHYQRGTRLKDFPGALEGILDKENILYYDALYDTAPDSDYDIPPIPLPLLYKIHSPEMVSRIKQLSVFDGAHYSSAGTVAAADRIFSGHIGNAFVFTGYGDHHAGYDFFGGGCYLNGAAISIQMLKDTFGIKRFAVIDTDAHHGDGSWALFENDPEVLYICFCSGQFHEKNANINIEVPFDAGDRWYLDKAKEIFEKKVMPFHPSIIFWNWGYDGTKGDYGDMGLTPSFHLQLAGEFKKAAAEICSGRLITILCGGSRRDLAALLIPRIIKILAGLG